MSDNSILFVCLGNICRSPMAEGAFRKRAEEAGLDVRVDSAGTADYHVGDPPDERAVATARDNGVDISMLLGRQIEEDDFRNFSHIVVMDEQNKVDVEALRPSDGTATVMMALDPVPGQQGRPIADPWHGNAADFTATWNEVDAAASALVGVLAAEEA